MKMLMTVKGISGEKAIEIQKYFPTVINLVESLAQVSEEEGRKLVGETCTKVGRRKIGVALSTKIYEIFGPQVNPGI
jgi:crossover junction endonuclease MUS81